ncbi:restriction endonuclease subunit S [Proteus mirabilis]|uniref:restriction endonuclease subunit S n=1 Tax=Proteus mirabilis TaxID=584 RepID=UPI001A2A0FE7|nr:restriction endonuclease subunit S [Proteus mirabilis]MBI6252425.1 restriction endonuclease subunit S [Proteus mirabilis]MBI6289413.1 restriction endonuclease subunit S [Proteus mirabilis]MDM9218010.1 restriction endonuclease subunit S [Proteus mirabilis]
MGSKFETRLLGELCHEITVGFVGTMTNEYIENGIPFLRSKNIEEYDVKWDDMKYVSSAFHKKLSKSVLKPGDVAIVRTGKPGTTCVIPNDLREANCSDIVIARVNNELLCPHYLSYFMNAMAHGQVNAHIVGAVQQHFNVSSAKKLEIPLPSRVKQTKIVQVLKTLDDKLKLNRQINQTLEQMAQTLFKSWFVDFDPVVDNALDAGFFEQDLAFSDELLHRVEVRKAVRESDNFKPLSEDIRRLFPDAFEECAEPALGLGGWVPSGWELGNLSDVTNILSGFAFKSNEFQNSGFGVIKIKNIGNDKSVDICDIQRIDISLAEKAKRFSLKDGDLLMAMTGATVGKFGFLVTENQEPYYLNQRVAKFEAIDESTAYLYCILNRKITESYIVNTAQGSAQPNISAKDILAMPLITAPQSIRELFNDKVNDSFQKIIQMRKQNIILEHLRDTLLPKLISGELSLSDIKIDIPEETLI